MSKVAFLFPGQGAQTVGMGQSLVELPAAARCSRKPMRCWATTS